MSDMKAEHLVEPDLGALGAFALLLLSIYMAVMYCCWGTLSMSKVQAEYKERQELDGRHQSTFQRRDDLLYHIGASTQRGERHQAAILEKQLVKVDRELDLLEERLLELDTRRHRSGQRPKLKI